MPSISRDKLQLVKPTPGIEMSEIQWGGMTVGFTSIQEPAVGMDMAPLFKALSKNNIPVCVLPLRA